MPYQARKSMNLGGYQVSKGDLVPNPVIDKIPPLRFASMMRIGLLQEVTPAQAMSAAATVTTIEEDSAEEGEEFCPICQGGPYRRLGQHLSRMHSDSDS